MISAIWKLIVKYESLVLVAIAVGLAIAHEITDDATYASIMGLITIVAITRLAMHPMWKKDEQGEEKATD